MARARRCSTTLVMAIITTLCACSLACGAHHALALDAETPNVIESTAADQPASASETGTQNTPPSQPLMTPPRLTAMKA